MLARNNFKYYFQHTSTEQSKSNVNFVIYFGTCICTDIDGAKKVNTKTIGHKQSKTILDKI